MTQITLGVAVALPEAANEKCVFCGKQHQDEKAAGTENFDRDMTKLKNEGRSTTIEKGNRLSKYPSATMAPLVKWEKDINKTEGYKAAAHHCIALKCVSGHKMSGELKAAGYNPNNGNNCIWLPYSKPQFSRARAYNRPLQKHRGGHTDAYFKKVTKHVNFVLKLMKDKFCTNKKKGDKESLLRFIEDQEDAIWNGVANPMMSAYHLYNESYLDPYAPWGSFDYEKGLEPEDIKGKSTPQHDDDDAESDNKDDTEATV